MFSLIGLICTLSSVFAQEMDIVYEWKLLNYNTPPNYPKNGSYRADLTRIHSIEVGFDRMFFAMPELFCDNPASLAYVNTGEIDPPLKAYPNWDWHVNGVVGMPTSPSTCQGFISAQRLRVDRCDRLWVLDSGLGYHRQNQGREHVCPPKLVAFDLNSHTEVKRMVIKREVLMPNSDLINFVIDDTNDFGAQLRGECDVGHIYIGDVAAPGVIVVDVKREAMWRHSDPAFWPHPDHAKVTVSGESLVMRGGIFGIALSSPGLGNHRDFYFKPMASDTIYSVNTAALKSRPNPIPQLRELPVQKVCGEASHALPVCYDKTDDALLFSPLDASSLMAYELANRTYRTMSEDSVALQFVTEVHSPILDDNNIWLSSTRLQKVFFDTVNPREINQRVLRLRRNKKNKRSL